MAGTHPETELVPFLRGELSARERDRVQHHLDGCVQCRESMDGLGVTMRQVASRLEELPVPEWSVYRRELRLKLARRTEAPSLWRRPGIIWGSLATAGVGLAALLLSLTMRPSTTEMAPPAVDQLAMEQAPEGIDQALLRDYPVVEHLELLEDYDVIEHLDQLPGADQPHDTRS